MKNYQLIKVNPLAYVLILLSLLCGYFKYLCILLFVLFIHELGHLFFCFIFKRRVCSINIYPTGGLININAPISTNIYEDLLISIGGICFQVVIGSILNILFNSTDLEYFNFYNRLIILFNMLPICPLDGYRIVTLILELFIPFRLSLRVSFIISILCFTTLIVFYNELVHAECLVFIFILFMQINEFKLSRFILYRFYLERLCDIFYFPKKKNISHINNMYKNRLNYLNGQSEHIFLRKKFKNF